MELKEVFTQRRSVNFFDGSKVIDESVIREIFDLAKLALSSFNLQPWKIVLVRDSENKERLRKCAFDQPKVTEASHVAIMLGDRKAHEKMDPIIDDFIKRGVATEDARERMNGMAKNLYGGDNDRAFAGRNVGLFAMAFMLAAESLGVHTHPMDGFNADAVRKEFNIPEEYDVVMLIAIGRFDEAKALAPRGMRRNYDDVVVKERFPQE